MKEEEVDPFFKNKFSKYTPVPPADAWARLQSKMEPPQKRATMWVYYAAAAVTLVLLAGVLIFWQRTQELKSSGTLAQQAPVTNPVKLEPTAPLVANAGTEKEPIAAPTEIAGVYSGNSRASKTQNATISASKAVKKVKGIRPGILIAAAEEPVKSTRKSAPVLPATNGTKINEPESVPTLASLPSTTAGNVMEVVIKKDAAENIALAPANEQEFETASAAIRDNLAKKGKLVKSIFKQARKLKNGDKVELSALGLNANYRIDVESKILKQKYSKVINL